MLSLAAVDVEFDYRVVLEAVTMTFEPGVRYALTAANGSGKTSLLRVLAGLLRPTRGQVLWQGNPLTAAHRGRLGVVLQQPFLYADLTGAENLRFYGRLYGVDHLEHVVSNWLEQLDLIDAAAVRVRDYSKGMRQRLSLARALIHQPTCLLLDEPYDGLDGKGRQTVADRLAQQVDAGSTLLVVTHLEQETHPNDVRLTLEYGRLVGVV